MFASLLVMLGCRPADNGGSIFTASTTLDSSTGQTGASETSSSSSADDDTESESTGDETMEEGGCEKVDFCS